MDVRKLPRPPKAAEKFSPFFFFGAKSRFRGKMTNFGAFQNFTDARFATFSFSTDVSFRENENSTV